MARKKAENIFPPKDEVIEVTNITKSKKEYVITRNIITGMRNLYEKNEEGKYEKMDKSRRNPTEFYDIIPWNL